MARGHQKFQSQQKNLKKQEELKKSKGSDQKAAAIKALTHKCTVCMVMFSFGILIIIVSSLMQALDVSFYMNNFSNYYLFKFDFHFIKVCNL